MEKITGYLPIYGAVVRIKPTYLHAFSVRHARLWTFFKNVRLALIPRNPMTTAEKFTLCPPSYKALMV